ncbi:hypothetical protein PTTG_30135, partial [Puccinia triticina 1-1 BBBD Race 1]
RCSLPFALAHPTPTMRPSTPPQALVPILVFLCSIISSCGSLPVYRLQRRMLASTSHAVDALKAVEGTSSAIKSGDSIEVVSSLVHTGNAAGDSLKPSALGANNFDLPGNANSKLTPITKDQSLLTKDQSLLTKDQSLLTSETDTAKENFDPSKHSALPEDNLPPKGSSRTTLEELLRQKSNSETTLDPHVQAEGTSPFIAPKTSDQVAHPSSTPSTEAENAFAPKVQSPSENELLNQPNGRFKAPNVRNQRLLLVKEENPLQPLFSECN